MPCRVAPTRHKESVLEHWKRYTSNKITYPYPTTSTFLVFGNLQHCSTCHCTVVSSSACKAKKCRPMFRLRPIFHSGKKTAAKITMVKKGDLPIPHFAVDHCCPASLFGSFYRWSVITFTNFLRKALCRLLPDSSLLECWLLKILKAHTNSDPGPAAAAKQPSQEKQHLITCSKHQKTVSSSWFFSRGAMIVSCWKLPNPRSRR